MFEFPPARTEPKTTTNSPAGFSLAGVIFISGHGVSTILGYRVKSKWARGSRERGFSNSRGGIFTESDDDDTVGCYVTVFGEYEEMPRKAPAPGKAKGNRGETIALIAIMAGSALLVFYKAYTLITGTGGPVWESVLYIVGASIAAAVCGLTLFYSKEDRR